MNPDQSERSGILAGGNWIIDRPKIVDVYPAQDSLANILRETSSNGGSPYNVLIDLARLQAPFPLFAVGLVGDDPAGEFIRSDCRAHGIDMRQLRACEEAPTSYTDVMTVQSTGGGRSFISAEPTHFLTLPTSILPKVAPAFSISAICCYWTGLISLIQNMELLPLVS